MKILSLLLFLNPVSAIAESIAPYPMSAQLRDVISVVGPSWNNAGNYKAMLIRESESVALLIFRGPFDQHALVYVPNIAITGDFWGTIPWLTFDEGGRLNIHSENYAFGRNKWEKTLTVVEQHGEFIVSNFSFSSYDSLNLDEYIECQIDIENNKVVLNGQTLLPFTLPNKVLVRDWNGSQEQACFSEN